MFEPRRIDRIELHHVAMPLVHPFETSFGRQSVRPCILVAVYGDGLTGWGECTVDEGPWYAYETIDTAWHMLRDFLIPAVLGKTLSSPAEVVAAFSAVRGHPMARAALENAVWDLLAKGAGISLAGALGGQRDRVPVGVSVGIEPSLDDQLRQVERYLAQGYTRVKLKIKPGWDVSPVRAVREAWPDLALQVDANSAYTPADSAVFRELDQFDLLLIEQPLHHDDIVDHAKLQAMLNTPICLDESIHSPEHARWALDIDACRVINIKVNRVGGLTAARQIHDLAAERNVPVWCGGMLETNVGRSLNLALASLPNFRLPGDISASARYYAEDLAEPSFSLNQDSTITVPSKAGIGVNILPDRLVGYQLRHYASRSV